MKPVAKNVWPVITVYGSIEMAVEAMKLAGGLDYVSRSFLHTGIPELLKYGTFAGEVRPYTMHTIKPA